MNRAWLSTPYVLFNFSHQCLLLYCREYSAFWSRLLQSFFASYFKSACFLHFFVFKSWKWCLKFSNTCPVSDLMILVPRITSSVSHFSSGWVDINKNKIPRCLKKSVLIKMNWICCNKNSDILKLVTKNLLYFSAWNTYGDNKPSG